MFETPFRSLSLDDRRHALNFAATAAAAADGDLIAKVGDSIIELKNGCVCRSLNEDLGTALQEFAQKRMSGEMPDF